LKIPPPTSNFQEPAEMLCFHLALLLFLLAEWGIFVLDCMRDFCYENPTLSLAM
jgi:hypothetical protein